MPLDFCGRIPSHPFTAPVTYRQSKLTYLLKDSIGGNCKTCMIANIWPEIMHLEESISTLRFASRMMRVANESSINIQLDPKILLKKYEQRRVHIL